MNTLREEIAAIVKAIAENDADYWNSYGQFRALNQEAVVNGIIAAVVEHDGEEVLEAFGAA
jgi:hypothetical protein